MHRHASELLRESTVIFMQAVVGPITAPRSGPLPRTRLRRPPPPLLPVHEASVHVTPALLPVHGAAVLVLPPLVKGRSFEVPAHLGRTLASVGVRKGEALGAPAGGNRWDLVGVGG